MADFAPNFTPRVKMTYKAGTKPHSLIVRGPRGMAPGDAADLANRIAVFVHELRIYLYSDFIWKSVSYCAEDSEVFLPVSVSLLAPGGQVNPSARIAADDAIQVRAEGVSAGGSRTSFSIYGLQFRPSAGSTADFRVYGAELGEVNTALGALTEIGGELLYSADGAVAMWHNYLNYRYNSYYLTRLRG